MAAYDYASFPNLYEEPAYEVPDSGARNLPEYALVDAHPSDYSTINAAPLSLGAMGPSYSLVHASEVESTDTDEGFDYARLAPPLPPPRRSTDGDHLVVGVYMLLPEGWEERPHPFPHFVNTQDGSVHALDPRPLPPFWEQMLTPQGHCFFVNHSDRRTHWTHPCGASRVTPAVTADGRSYFLNHRTRVTTWTDPRLEPGFFDDICPGLPPGWEMRYTSTGEPFFLDHNTRKSHWNLPFA